jgi:YVTN family beta-propeller protein
MGSRFLRSILIALSLAAPATAGAQSFVYAVTSGGQPHPGCSPANCHPPEIHLINASTGHELSTISFGSAGDSARALAVSPDGTKLFLTTVNQTSPAPSGTLWIVDAVRRTVLAQIPTGGFYAPAVAVLPDNSRAYVVNSVAPSVVSPNGSLSVIDLATSTVTATVPLERNSTAMAVAPDGRAVYVTNSGSDTVSKVSTTTNTVEATIAVGRFPSAIDISPDGSRIFVANGGNGTISVIDANLDAVLRVIPAGSSAVPPVAVAAPSPSRVFVAFGVAVQLLNAADGATVGATPIGGNGRFARAPSGTPVYVLDTSELKHLADDGSTTTTVSTRSWAAAAVLTDPCMFEATLTPAAFGPAGGTATLTIGAPPGCGWTLDTASANGFSVGGGTLSSSGPATRTVSVTGGETPKLGTLTIGRQVLPLELTIPRMNIDFPHAGMPVLQEPFTLGGWAIDQNLGTSTSAARARGIDFLHVWVYPQSGAPIFVGATVPSVSRPDVAAYFGSSMTVCGFNLTVRSLPTGSYTLVVFAHSEISNTFVAAQAVDVNVARAPAPMVIDSPAASPPSPGPSGSIDPGTRVSNPFDVVGWALDTAAASGPGVDAVHVWAYPAAGGAPRFVGAAAQTARPDVAAIYGNQFLDSGFLLRGATLPAGTYDLVVFARSTVTGGFDTVRVVRITVQ